MHRAGRAREGLRDRLARASSATSIDHVMANPSGRVPIPEDIGRFVAMVVSEPCWHINGAHLRVDGGAADAVT